MAGTRLSRKFITPLPPAVMPRSIRETPPVGNLGPWDIQGHLQGWDLQVFRKAAGGSWASLSPFTDFTLSLIAPLTVRLTLTTPLTTLERIEWIKWVA